MLEFINGVLESIANFFSRIWDIFGWLFSNITMFFKIIKPAINFFQSLLSTIPSVYFGFGLAMLVVLIIYVILGRQAGGD